MNAGSVDKSSHGIGVNMLDCHRFENSILQVLIFDPNALDKRGFGYFGLLGFMAYQPL